MATTAVIGRKPKISFYYVIDEEEGKVERHDIQIPTEIMEIESAYSRRHIATMYALGAFSVMNVTYRHDAYSWNSFGL